MGGKICVILSKMTVIHSFNLENVKKWNKRHVVELKLEWRWKSSFRGRKTNLTFNTPRVLRQMKAIPLCVWSGWNKGREGGMRKSGQAFGIEFYKNETVSAVMMNKGFIWDKTADDVLKWRGEVINCLPESTLILFPTLRKLELICHWGNPTSCTKSLRRLFPCDEFVTVMKDQVSCFEIKKKHCGLWLNSASQKSTSRPRTYVF